MCSSTGLSTYLFAGFYLCVAQGSVTGWLIALIYLIFAVLDRYHLLCLPDFRLVILLYSTAQLSNNTRVFFVPIYLSYIIGLLRFLGVNYRRTKWEESLLLELHGTQPLRTSHIYNCELWCTDCVVYGMPVITQTSKILSEVNGITYIITLVWFFSQMTVNLNLFFPLTLCSSTSSAIFRIIGCIGPEG